MTMITPFSPHTFGLFVPPSWGGTRYAVRRDGARKGDLFGRTEIGGSPAQVGVSCLAAAAGMVFDGELVALSGVGLD